VKLDRPLALAVEGRLYPSVILHGGSEAARFAAAIAFARVLLCERPPTERPCGECRHCRRITLPEDAALRLNRIAGQRMTKDGVIVIHAQRFRTQERNRADATDRLLELLREAMVRPVPRRATKPTFGSKQRRLEGKKRRSDVKSKRGSGGFDD